MLSTNNLERVTRIEVLRIFGDDIAEMAPALCIILHHPKSVSILYHQSVRPVVALIVRIKRYVRCPKLNNLACLDMALAKVRAGPFVLKGNVLGVHSLRMDRDRHRSPPTNF
jgi:hypothetical protein